MITQPIGFVQLSLPASKTDGMQPSSSQHAPRSKSIGFGLFVLLRANAPRNMLLEIRCSKYVVGYRKPYCSESIRFEIVLPFWYHPVRLGSTFYSTLLLVYLMDKSKPYNAKTFERYTHTSLKMVFYYIVYI